LIRIDVLNARGKMRLYSTQFDLKQRQMLFKLFYNLLLRKGRTVENKPAN